jgi:hypothetical protein
VDGSQLWQGATTTMGVVWVGLGVVGVLAACLLLIFGIARAEGQVRHRRLRQRAHSDLQDRSRDELLAEISGKIERLEAEVVEVRASAGAYSTVGNAAGSVISLFAEIKELEEYRVVVEQLPE